VVEDIEDINDREQAEAKLQESEQRFRGLMEQAPMAISLFTPDGKLAQVNPAWVKDWGFDESETARVMAEYNRADRGNRRFATGPKGLCGRPRSLALDRVQRNPLGGGDWAGGC
jgi:PAS domain-containing protein